METSTSTQATYTSQTWLSSSQFQGVSQKTTVGAVTEQVNSEYVVALTPAATGEFVQNGHTVYIQTGFATRAGYTDEQYKQAGAQVLNTAEEVYMKSNVIVKVHPPQPSEYTYMQPQQVIFCFTTTTAPEEQQQQLLQTATEKKVTIISYSTLGGYTTNPTHTPYTYSPVYNALCEVYGYLGVQQAMTLMSSKGTIFGSIGGTSGTHVLILGAGTCGVRAATLAAATGAKVTVMDTNTDILRTISGQTPSVQTLMYTQQNLEMVLPTVNTLIGCVIPTYTKAPVLVTESQLQMMPQGSIAIDLAAPYGGNFQATKATTTQNFTYEWNGITMYTPTDITSLTPKTTSTAVSQAALPYMLQVANKGWKKAVMEFSGLQEGVWTAEGHVTNYTMATTMKYKYTPIEQVLEKEIQQVGSTQQQTVVSLKQQLNTFRTQQGTTFTIEA